MEGSPDDPLQVELISLFTDSVDMSISSSSLSTEERHSNTPSSEQEGDGRTRQPGMKKKDKNREAARKSRKKQTERADQLHQDLESLEGTNSALRKEIASLEREALLYTAALERHKPFCCLKGPGSGPADPLSVSFPDSNQTSTPAATSSASLGGSSPLTPAPAATSCELFSSGSSKTSPHSSFITAPAPHSLFHCPGADSSHPLCPVSIPQTHLVENLNDSKPSYSHPSSTNPGLPLSLLTVPSPLGAPQTSPGTREYLELRSSLEDTSRDISFLELLEVNDWILQEGETNCVVSEQ
ncbi:uncharacterized protein batf2 isoform X1 [Takifugu flavidus]|uniref:uncharacterized protein batf2 isoform X1 n=2 Tax=Takifugu flavidus TaxID=433684 RepID=UPI00254420DE|nr:uncharacterized protein batf2 isoform X1 [Takifugu flavidus]